MKIDYVAFDSFGVKSSCIKVTTKDISIVVDPGIASEVNSFPLTLAEKIILDRKYMTAIKRAIKSSDIVIFTHYHWDHVIPNPNLYKDKILLVKDPKKNINKSQKGRAAELLPKIKADIKIADGKEFKFGRTKIKFSKPLWHGVKGAKLGRVLMVTIADGKKRLVYTSDLDGPYLESYANLIIKENPTVLIMDAYPSYLMGFIASFENLKKVIKNTIKILEKTNAELYVLDHHLLRDYRYKELYYEVYKKAKELNKKVLTAAEVLSKKPKVIEGYEKNGPTRWKNWERFTFEKLNRMIKHAKKVAKKK